jgi:hypothetical protein
LFRFAKAIGTLALNVLHRNSIHSPPAQVPQPIKPSAISDKWTCIHVKVHGLPLFVFLGLPRNRAVSFFRHGNYQCEEVSTSDEACPFSLYIANPIENENQKFLFLTWHGGDNTPLWDSLISCIASRPTSRLPLYGIAIVVYKVDGPVQSHLGDVKKQLESLGDVLTVQCPCFLVFDKMMGTEPIDTPVPEIAPLGAVVEIKIGKSEPHARQSTSELLDSFFRSRLPTHAISRFKLPPAIPPTGAIVQANQERFLLANQLRCLWKDHHELITEVLLAMRDKGQQLESQSNFTYRCGCFITGNISVQQHPNFNGQFRDYGFVRGFLEELVESRFWTTWNTRKIDNAKRSETLTRRQLVVVVVVVLLTIVAFAWTVLKMSGF